VVQRKSSFKELILPKSPGIADTGHEPFPKTLGLKGSVAPPSFFSFSKPAAPLYDRAGLGGGEKQAVPPKKQQKLPLSRKNRSLRRGFSFSCHSYCFLLSRVLLTGFSRLNFPLSALSFSASSRGPPLNTTKYSDSMLPLWIIKLLGFAPSL